jgi:hypothetical protein
MTALPAASGGIMPPGCAIIEVRVGEPHQIFHPLDASPYRDRLLDPRVEEYIVHRAAAVPRGAPVGLIVHLDRPPTTAEAEELTGGIRQCFARKAAGTRRELRELFRRGRVSLVIGLAFLSTLTGLAEVLAATTDGGGLAGIVRESLVIGGWVAMWHPLEVFLYDWWPIRSRAERYERLAGIPIGIRCAEPEGPWRSAARA